MNEPGNREETIFHAALQLGPEKRAAYLALACEGDDGLLRRIEVLLQAEAEADPFFRKEPLHVVMGARPEEQATRKEASRLEDLGDRIDRYKLLQKLGEGGFGAVYMAEQKEPVKRRVALKIIKLGMDTRQVVARFEAERQALALMDHPNIAKVLDAGATESGRPYFVMELVRGIKITEYCDQNNLPAPERLKLFIQVCHAIQHAHQKGLIHRDIKPSNILVTLHDGVAVPKVIDFGIAKATQQELTEKTLYTELQQFIGTPAYMSPEQAEMSGLDIDTRSDIYSLGVLLYELLTGKTPFDAKELMAYGLDEMRRTIREKEPMRPSTRLTMELERVGSARVPRAESGVAPDSRSPEANAHEKRLPREGFGGTPKPAREPRALPEHLRTLVNTLRGDLDWIMMKCLEKDRTRRYETANSLASDIQRHLNSEPVEARPPSPLYRLRKLARRNKIAFAAAAAAVAMVLVLGTVISTWQAIRATKAEQKETLQRKIAEANEEKAQRAQASEATARQAAEEQRQRAEAQELTARQRAYASDMNLAQQALAVNNLGRALELLDRHRPAAPSQISDGKSQTQTDLRGWEWRYLWQQCQGDPLFSLCQKTDWIWSVAVSHDGKWVAVGEHLKGSLSVWDLRSRQEIASLQAGDGYVRAAFSPTKPLLAFSFVTDIKSTNAQHKVQLWNGATRQIVAELPLGGLCNGLSFSDDGQRLVTSTGLITLTAAPGNELTVWRVPEGTKLTNYPASQGGSGGTAFAAARDLSIAAHRIDTGSIRVVDLSTGEERWRARATAVESISALAFSPDAKVLASGPGFGESEIRLWDVASGKEIRRLQGHSSAVGALVFWPDGKTLASASDDQTIRLWDLTAITNVPPPRILRGHQRGVTRLALAPDGTTLVSGSRDGSVYCWDIAASRHDLGPAELPTKLQAWRFSPDNKSVLAVDKQGRLTQWHGADFQEPQPLLEFSTNILGACLSSDGRLAAVGLNNGIVQVADMHRRALVGRFQAHSGPVSPQQFLTEGKKLVILHVDDRSFHEWDLTTWRKTRSWQGAPGIMTGPYFATAFSPDEQSCLTLAWTGASLLTNLAADHPSHPQLDISTAVDAAYSPDGKLVAASSARGFAKLWETDTWREVVTLSGFALGVYSVAFSPDGKRLATSSHQKEAIKLWDIESKQDVLTLEGQGARFQSAAFSSDGNVLGSMNDQGVLHLWRAPSWEDIAEAEKAESKAVSP